MSQLSNMFFVIGAMKSGTTSLHSNLDLHPEISMSNRKEPNYFSKYSDKPISWYQAKFKKGERLLGDATPSYTWRHMYPECAENMYRCFPDSKLIYIVRDPIDRIISHLHHDLYRGRIDRRKVDEVIREDFHYINTSKFYYQIEAYLEFWDLSKILFVDFNYFVKNTNEVLNQICDFLEVKNYNFTDKLKYTNNTGKKYLIKGHDTVHQFLPGNIAKMYHYLWYIINIKIERPRLTQESLNFIKANLNQDINKFKSLAKNDFDLWKTYDALN